MHGVKRIFVINIICLLLIFSSETLHIIAQNIEPLSAVVTVERDFLRIQPSSNANSKALVVKGTKLKVGKSNTVKGWYLAYLEEAPSVYGYIYGNSIKFVKPQITAVPKKQVVLNKQNTGLLPKDIILDKSPTLDTNQTQSQSQIIKDKLSNNKSNKVTTRSNYCQPPLFCPDVDEVQVALFENSDRFQKGKFEKTVDWEKRKSIMLSEIKLKGGRTAGDKMSFLYEVGTASLTYNEPQYDADKEIWSFDLQFFETYGQTCLPILSQNTAEIFCLIVPQNLGTKLKEFVSMPPALAKTNEKRLQIAFSGRIIEPYIWLNDNSPIKDIRSGIHFALEEIICLNPITGQRWKVDIPTITNGITITSNQTKIGTSPKVDIPTKTEGATKISDDIKTEMPSLEYEELAQLRKTLAANPMNAEAYLGIGQFLTGRGKYEEAITSLKTALYWDSRLIEAHIELSRIYFIKRDCKQAQIYSQSALEIDNQNEVALTLKRAVNGCSELSIKSKDIGNTLPKTESEQIGNSHSSEENKRQFSFEGKWKMTIEYPTYSLQSKIPIIKSMESNLTIIKKGSKYEGNLSYDSSSTRIPNVKFDGRNFEFEFSEVNNSLQISTIKVKGYFDADSIKAIMTISFADGEIKATNFNGTRFL